MSGSALPPHRATALTAAQSAGAVTGQGRSLPKRTPYMTR